MRVVKILWLLIISARAGHCDFAPEDIGGYSGLVIIQSGSGWYYNSGSFRYT